MKLLVLGGTRFVGRHLAEAALRDGHSLTLFNRGRSAPGLFPGAETLHGDRAGDHAALAGGTWDAVVDVSAYRPREVRAAMASLRGRAGRYVFVSTVSVYRAFEAGGAEDAPACEPAGDPEPALAPDTYGPLKRACELALEREWGGPWSVARPCVVAGPHDSSDRFTYWPARLARAGRVLAPGAPGAFAQIVDARDLADWLLLAALGGAPGIFNVAGPPRAFPAFLDDCAPPAGARPDIVFAGDEFLASRGVVPGTDLPLWLPGRPRPFDASKAAAAGLRARPVEETAADVLRWRAAGPLVAGLDAEREARLLAEIARQTHQAD
ncbi:MAG: NAD-dependent epimerase/dehydratase family protein [Elusimicrobiota bacterium]